MQSEFQSLDSGATKTQNQAQTQTSKNSSLVLRPATFSEQGYKNNTIIIIVPSHKDGLFAVLTSDNGIVALCNYYNPIHTSV